MFQDLVSAQKFVPFAIDLVEHKLYAFVDYKGSPKALNLGYPSVAQMDSMDEWGLPAKDTAVLIDYEDCRFTMDKERSKHKGDSIALGKIKLEESLVYWANVNDKTASYIVVGFDLKAGESYSIKAVMLDHPSKEGIKVHHKENGKFVVEVIPNVKFRA